MPSSKKPTNYDEFIKRTHALMEEHDRITRLKYETLRDAELHHRPLWASYKTFDRFLKEAANVSPRAYRKWVEQNEPKKAKG